MKINNFIDFVKESVSNNIIVDSVNFQITYDELSEILVDIMDELPHLTYSIESAIWYKNNGYINDSDNCFMIVFENEKGIEDVDRRLSNDYFLHTEERKIISGLKEIEDKFNLYNIYIKENDFANSDYEYYLLVSKNI